MLSLELALLAFMAVAFSQPTTHAKGPRDNIHWHGFASIENLFVFGTSYDATTQPLPWMRSSNGPNWVDYITTIFNQSVLTPYNYAFPGATTDDLTPTILIPTIKTQVELEFLPLWEPIFALNKEYSDNSLFVLFAFPVNDIILPAKQKNTEIPITGIFDDWTQMLDDLYKAGARNFVFNNLPDLSVLPVIIESNKSTQQGVIQGVTSWNEQVYSLAFTAREKYPDITIFQPDMYSVFRQASQNPGQFPETAVVTNTTGYCSLYENGTPTPTTFYPECGIPVDQYMFLNSIHPQSPLHKLIAHILADTLQQ